MTIKYPFILPPNARLQRQHAKKDDILEPGTVIFNEKLKELKKQLDDAKSGSKHIPELIRRGKINESVAKKMKKDIKASMEMIECRIENLLKKKSD